LCTFSIDFLESYQSTIVFLNDFLNGENFTTRMQY
jgi:hypothetical protein